MPQGAEDLANCESKCSSSWWSSATIPSAEIGPNYRLERRHCSAAHQTCQQVSRAVSWLELGSCGSVSVLPVNRSTISCFAYCWCGTRHGAGADCMGSRLRASERWKRRSGREVWNTESDSCVRGRRGWLWSLFAGLSGCDHALLAHQSH